VEKLIRCPCGAVLRSADEAELVQSARTHAREVHDMDLSDEQARDMIQPA
jgi:predicted small metal-binding protein